MVRWIFVGICFLIALYSLYMIVQQRKWNVLLRAKQNEFIQVDHPKLKVRSYQMITTFSLICMMVFASGVPLDYFSGKPKTDSVKYFANQNVQEKEIATVRSYKLSKEEIYTVLIEKYPEFMEYQIEEEFAYKLDGNPLYEFPFSQTMIYVYETGSDYVVCNEEDCYSLIQK